MLFAFRNSAIFFALGGLFVAPEIYNSLVKSDFWGMIYQNEHLYKISQSLHCILTLNINNIIHETRRGRTYIDQWWWIASHVNWTTSDQHRQRQHFLWYTVCILPWRNQTTWGQRSTDSFQTSKVLQRKKIHCTREGAHQTKKITQLRSWKCACCWKLNHYLWSGLLQEKGF